MPKKSGTNQSEPRPDAELPINVIVLFGEERRLERLKGRKARLMFPKLLGLVGWAIQALTAAGVNFDQFTGEEVSLDDVVGLFVALSRFFSGERWEEFEVELLPFLLQEPEGSTRLEQEGDLVEVYWALYRAVKYYIKDGFSSPQLTALGKLFQEAERRKNSPSPAEDQELAKAKE